MALTGLSCHCWGQDSPPPAMVTLNLFRERLLPCEPLLFEVTVQNASANESLEVTWPWWRCTEVQFRASTGIWMTVPDRPTVHKGPSSSPPVALKPGESVRIPAEARPMVVPGREARPLLPCGQWVLRAQIGLGAGQLVASKPVMLEVVDPVGSEGVLGCDEFDAYWQLRLSIGTDSRAHYDALAWCLIPRGKGTLAPPSRREQLVRFVSAFPRSEYSLFLRYTFMACRDDGYMPTENALCEEYRQFLQKNAMGFFPDSMRGVFAAQP